MSSNTNPILCQNQISKEFLETALKTPVSSIEVKSGANPGDNVQSTIAAIRVNLQSGEILNLVHKSFPPGGHNSIYTIKFFKNEGIFYLNVLPLFENIGKDPIPKFLGGFTDGRNDWMLMEDLRPKGYVMLDKFVGLPFAEAGLALREIGKFHASTYKLLRFHGEKVFDSDHIPKDTFKNTWIAPPGEVEAGEGWFPVLYQNAIELLAQRGESNRKLVEAMKSIDKEKVFKMATSVARKTDKKYFPLIIHGDFWMNNIMYRYDGNVPVSVKFIDFQQTRRGNVLEDLLYFIFTSTTPKLRKSHLLQLLNIYYDSFASTLEEIKCPLPIGFTRGEFIDSFYCELLSPFAYLVFAIPLQLQETPLEFTEVIENQDNHGDDKQEEDDFDEAFMKRLRFLLETSPRGLDRLEDVVRELMELKILPVN